MVEIAKDEPVFETGLLLAGDVDANHIRRQLTRWVKSGKIHQLRRGLYALAPPYRRVKPHPFAIANRMVPGSYVSCQSALAHFGLIPEYAPTVISVCACRPGSWETPLGSFRFRHIHRKYVFGIRLLELGAGQQAHIATPEKSLLDLIYLTPGGDLEAYLRSLRLQNWENLDLQKLLQTAETFGKPKLRRSADVLESLAREARLAEVGE